MKHLLVLLSLFAVAMALLESAVVVYMRRLYYPDSPLDLFPMQFLGQYDPILEFSREVATIVMIVAVALLAGQKTRTRQFAAFVFVFGTWDLFYYVWLKVLIGWPRNWLEWDVLFLIPAIWLGPWICPAAIAALFMLWGGWVLTSKREIRFALISWTTFTIGAVLGLVAFMQPALGMTREELTQYMPGAFWWWLFGISYGLMTVGFAMTVANSNQAGTVDRNLAG